LPAPDALPSSAPNELEINEAGNSWGCLNGLLADPNVVNDIDLVRSAILEVLGDP
jgi:hypothetical protein